MSTGIGVALLFGNLGPCGLLTRALGLLSCRLVGVLGLGSSIGGCLEGLVVDGLGVGVGLGLRLRRALCRGATAAAGTDIGGIGIGRCGSLGGRSVLDRSIGRGRGLGRHRCALSSSCCGSGFLGLNIRLGLAAATMRAQSRINGGNLAGLSVHDGLSGGSALPFRRTSRSCSDLRSRLLGGLLHLGCRTATRARCRLLGRLLGNRSLGGDRRGKLSQCRGLALGSATAGANNLGLADLCQCTGLRDLIGNRGRRIGGSGPLHARGARRATLGLCGLLAVRSRFGHTTRTLGLSGRNLLASNECGGRGGLRRLGSRDLRRRWYHGLVRRNRCSGSRLRRRYFIFLLLIRHSVCSTFFSSPAITCSLHIPSGRLNSLAPSKKRRASLICIEMIASYTQRKCNTTAATCNLVIGDVHKRLVKRDTLALRRLQMMRLGSKSMASGFAAPRNVPIYYAYPWTPDHTLVFSETASPLPAVLILRFSAWFGVRT